MQWAAPAAVAMGLLGLPPLRPIEAPTPCVQLKSSTMRSADSIGLLYGPELSPQLVEEAIELWRSCANYRSGFPMLVHGADASRIVTIDLEKQSRTRRCGSFRGTKIVLYHYATYRRGQRISCGSLAQNLAHEIGHLLGLEDNGGPTECPGHIMTKITRRNSFARSIEVAECRAVGKRWITSSELDRLQSLAGLFRGTSPSP